MLMLLMLFWINIFGRMTLLGQVVVVMFITFWILLVMKAIIANGVAIGPILI
jgi:hypothetical protein